MVLYQEILFLKHWFKGKWVIENVISYYDPLVKPYIIGNHYYWANFNILNKKEENRMIIRMSDNDLIKDKQKRYGVDLIKYEIFKRFKVKMLNNMVEPKTGLHVFNCAFKERQVTLNGLE